jgi:hypothetical protein
MDAIIPIVVRRGSLSDWTTSNPVLRYGEYGLIHVAGIASTPSAFVIGNGVDDFNTLWATDMNHFVPLGVILLNHLTPAVISLQNALSTEATNRSNADTALANSITSENTARVNADTNLQNQIDTEESERESGDANLQSAVDTVSGALSDLTSSLANWFGLATQAGDLIVFDSSTGTLNIIPRGTDGQYLVSDSAEDKGLKWNTLSVAWADVTGKPTEFTPEAHVHAASEITSGTIDTARLGSGTPDNTLFLRGDQTWDSVMYSQKFAFEHFNHFTNSAANGAVEAVLNSGTGAGITNVQTNSPMGVIQFTTGSTATGVSMFRHANNNAFQNGTTTKVFKARVRITQLSTALQTFTFRTGFSNTVANADGSQSVTIRYTHSENSGNWTCCSRQNNVETTANSAIPVVANQWYELEVRVNTTNATFYIDGTLVATITTNLPTSGGAQYFGYVIQTSKSVGTTGVTTQADWYYAKVPNY